MSSSTNDPVLGLLSDDVRDGSEQRPDDLDRSDYAKHVANLLDRVRNQSESAVLALIGDWGAGKSTVIELLRSRLNEPWSVATFNPWTYPDTESLQRGFFSELAAALPKEDRPGNARTTIGTFARTISPVGKVGSLIGVDLETPLRALGDIIAGDTSASAAKKSAEDALRRASIPVLMIVDDLDRLTPDELLEVLKLVRLVGRLPFVYYLLSYDERTLLDVLRRTPVTGDNEGRARAYMEKIVQVRLDLPALRSDQRMRLLDEGLQQIGVGVDPALSSDDQQRLGEIYGSVLDRRLTTPRAINRFLGQVQAFYSSLHGEVDFVDFFIATWLRTQEPGVYKLLHTERAELLGLGLSSHLGERGAAAQKARRELWEQRLHEAHVRPEHLDGVVRALSALFPEIAAAFTSSQHFTRRAARRTPKAISDLDYFDRYVSFGVPPDDVADAEVKQAVNDLHHTSTSPAVTRLADQLKAETARTMRKLEALRSDGVSIPEYELFNLVACTSTSIDRERLSLFEDPWRAAVHSGAGCLSSMDGKRAAQAIKHLGNEPRLVEFVVDVAWRLQPNDQSTRGDFPPAGFDYAPVAEAASAVIAASFATRRNASPLDDGAMTLFWPWHHIDPAAAHRWLADQVDTDRWQLSETMGALTSTTIPIGPGPKKRSIGDFDVQVVDEIFSLERVFTDLSPLLDTAEPLTGDPFHQSATRENRIQQALYILRKARELRAENTKAAGGKTPAP